MYLRKKERYEQAVFSQNCDRAMYYNIHSNSCYRAKTKRFFNATMVGMFCLKIQIIPLAVFTL